MSQELPTKEQELETLLQEKKNIQNQLKSLDEKEILIRKEIRSLRHSIAEEKNNILLEELKNNPNKFDEIYQKKFEEFIEICKKAFNFLNDSSKREMKIIRGTKWDTIEIHIPPFLVDICISKKDGEFYFKNRRKQMGVSILDPLHVVFTKLFSASDGWGSDKRFFKQCLTYV